MGRGQQEDSDHPGLRSAGYWESGGMIPAGLQGVVRGLCPGEAQNKQCKCIKGQTRHPPCYPGSWSAQRLHWHTPSRHTWVPIRISGSSEGLCARLLLLVHLLRCGRQPSADKVRAGLSMPARQWRQPERGRGHLRPAARPHLPLHEGWLCLRSGRGQGGGGSPKGCPQGSKQARPKEMFPPFVVSSSPPAR